MYKIGYIYKITNIKNNKVYIGQTKQSIEQRFIQHKSHARNYRNNHKLGNAIRKYGEDNFIIEKIEECQYSELDEKERFWIKYYNSVENGYNTLSGGQDKTIYYELDNQQEIIDYYYQCHNQQEVIKKFNITDYKFRQLLLKNNLPTDYTNYGKHSQKKIIIIELHKIFEKAEDCAQFLIENKYTNAKIECVKIGISKSVSNHIPYLNLSFKDYNEYLQDNSGYNIKKRPTKEELEEKIKDNSIISLSSLYNVHETTLRRWLKKYNIEIPKKEKEKNKCIDCNKEIGKKAIRCKSCSAKHSYLLSKNEIL